MIHTFLIRSPWPGCSFEARRIASTRWPTTACSLRAATAPPGFSRV